MLYQIEFEWTANNKKHRAEFVAAGRNMQQAENKCRKLRPDIPADTDARSITWLHDEAVAI